MSDWKPGMPVEQPERGSRLFPVEVAKERQKELQRRGQIVKQRAAKRLREEHWAEYLKIQVEVDAERGLLPGERDPADDSRPPIPRTPQSVWLAQ